MIFSELSDDVFIDQRKSWKEEIIVLRNIILKTKLSEQLKWKKPCYCFKDTNIAIIQPFKSCLGLMFFKGSQLTDKKSLLVKNEPYSKYAKRLEFRSVSDVKSHKSDFLDFMKQAVAIEIYGSDVEVPKIDIKIPGELILALKRNYKLKQAFEALSPGRQRSYIFHILGGK